MTTFDAARFEAVRRERGIPLGFPLSAVAVTGSTNDDAMAAARAGAADGATFLADCQTKGRGRLGARWSSAPGENLLLSVVLRRGFTLDRVGTLTLAVGLAVRDAVARRVECPVRVKWPNDLMAEGRKLAGILVESQLRGDAIDAVVVGVGLNVAMRAPAPEIAGIATSLALLGADDLERETLLCDVLAEMESRVAGHAQHGLAVSLDELRRHDALLGRRVRADALGGTACGIADDGALLIRDPAGSVHAIRSGAIEMR